jgi:hypothetical protein
VSTFIQNSKTYWFSRRPSFSWISWCTLRKEKENDNCDEQIIHSTHIPLDNLYICQV